VDDSGQPGGEPVGVNGNGAHNQGVARVDANGWQQPDTYDSRPDGARGDALRSGAARPTSSYTDGSWSAGVRESAMEPIPSWRRSAVTQLTDRPEQPRRLADLLAPVSPPVPTPFPYDDPHTPDGQFPGPEPVTGPPAPGPAMNGSVDHRADRSLSQDGHQNWVPRSRPGQVPGIDEPASPYAGFEPHHAAAATYDDLPALAETTAASLTGHGTEPHAADPYDAAAPRPGWAGPGQVGPDAPGRAERPWQSNGVVPPAVSGWPGDAGPSSRAPWPDNGARPPLGSPWAVPSSGGPTPVPPVDRHRYEPEDGEPDAPPRFNGSVPGPGPDGRQRFDAPAPVSPAVPYPGATAPARPSAQPWPGGEPRAEVPPNHADAARAGMARPDAPAESPHGQAEPGRASAGPPVEPKIIGRPALAPPIVAPAEPAREPVDESVLDDPWADPARYAAVYRESMSAIRAASAGVAAAEARAAAEDHAAVQAAYTQAVDATHPGAAPLRPGQSPSPNTPLGQPSLADYVDRPAGADRPRMPVVPRQPGPADDAAPVAHVVPGGRGEQSTHGEQSTYGEPSSHAAQSGRPQIIQARPLSHAVPGEPGSANPPEPPAPPRQTPPASGQSGLPVPPRLPQRIPAAPDVPEVPDDDLDDDDDFVDHSPDLTAVNPPELARIATGLRYNEDLEEPPRPDGFDTLAVLAAVRAVPGVRDAQLRPNPSGAGVQTLRLDLADGADGAQVSRLVARLLKQRMGLAAEPRRTGEPRRTSAPPNNLATPPAAPTGPSAAPNVGQPHRDSGSMPVAGTAPAPRIPMPTSATEHLGGPVATNADDRSRRRPAPTARARTLEADEQHRVIRSAAAPRVVIDQVQVSTLGLDATVEVRLTSGGTPAIGVASGPAVDGYVLRLAAVAATAALDQLLATVDSWEQPGRCFVEHAAVVPFGSVDVAVVVVLLVCGTAAEQLTGAALVSGDPRQAVVRATLAAVNRRLDTLVG
jgi:hypothetical protein